MDVSGWTIDQKMRLPDWCFGNRRLMSLFMYNSQAETTKWAIHDTPFPDPMCIWDFHIWTAPTSGGKGEIKIGLDVDVPTSEGEMAAADEIFPYYGLPQPGPNKIQLNAEIPILFEHRARQGMVTGGKYLVMQLWCQVATIRANVTFLVSGLPTSMAGWLSHNK